MTNIQYSSQQLFQIVFDDPLILNHKKTTDEIKQCAKDIKVLGRKDLRNILTWRKLLHDELVPAQALSVETETVEEDEIKTNQKEATGEDDDLKEIDQQIVDLQDEELREEKRKKKKALKERKKLNERLNLKMILKNDDGPTMEGDDMFSLKQIPDKNKLKKIIDQVPDVVVQSDEEDGIKHTSKYTRYEKGQGHLDSSGTYYKDSDSELEMESDEDNDDTIKEGLGDFFNSLSNSNPVHRIK